ncbi:unnamed protein product [Amoebophrya sp. A120]|nr:unnamed protein product [Amoebophrya sp. A120]|eukprot:GSA120T00005877001.1
MVASSGNARGGGPVSQPSPEVTALATEFRELQKQLQTNYDSRMKLLTQQEENQTVAKEFAILEQDGVVYKLIGPVLVRQNLEDAKGNVDKRLNYIKEELDRADKVIVELEKDLEGKKVKLTDLMSAGGAAAPATQPAK